MTARRLYHNDGQRTSYFVFSLLPVSLLKAIEFAMVISVTGVGAQSQRLGEGERVPEHYVKILLIWAYLPANNVI